MSSTGSSPLWCRVEMEGPRVRRVVVMHANGEILVSWPGGRFEPTILRRMCMGEVRAALETRDGLRVVSLSDAAGRVLFSESLPVS
jgi:hypothetical protein